jgi:hypothetical protein
MVIGEHIFVILFLQVPFLQPVFEQPRRIQNSGRSVFLLTLNFVSFFETSIYESKQTTPIFYSN